MLDNADFYLTRDTLVWAAQECEWQVSGEMSVVWMLDGWAWLSGIDPAHRLTVNRILKLSTLVEPRANAGEAFRQCNVRVGYSVKMPYEEVPAAMKVLIAAQRDLTPDEWFYQYEEIHPFRDGNGRTGNLLWNWLRGTLGTPEMPPNFWNDPRREG